MTGMPDGPWYYQQIELGYNDRITDIQAALGLSQLQRLDDYIARRQALAHLRLHLDLGGAERLCLAQGLQRVRFQPVEFCVAVQWRLRYH